MSVELASRRKKRLIQCHLMLNSTSLCSLMCAGLSNEVMTHELRVGCMRSRKTLTLKLWLPDKSPIVLADHRVSATRLRFDSLHA
jgi:hypothetical protein